MSDIKFRCWQLAFALFAFARPVPTIRKVLDNLLGFSYGSCIWAITCQDAKEFSAQHDGELFSNNCWVNSLLRCSLSFCVPAELSWNQQLDAGILAHVASVFWSPTFPSAVLAEFSGSFSFFGAELSSNLCARAWLFATPHPLLLAEPC